MCPYPVGFHALPINIYICIFIDLFTFGPPRPNEDMPTPYPHMLSSMDKTRGDGNHMFTCVSYLLLVYSDGPSKYIGNYIKTKQKHAIWNSCFSRPRVIKVQPDELWIIRDFRKYSNSDAMKENAHTNPMYWNLIDITGGPRSLAIAFEYIGMVSALLTFVGARYQDFPCLTSEMATS